MTKVPVRLTLTVEIDVPLETTIDLEEFQEWAASGPAGEPNAEPTDEKVLEFINSAQDMLDIISQFPTADARHHLVSDTTITDAEIL